MTGIEASGAEHSAGDYIRMVLLYELFGCIPMNQAISEIKRVFTTRLDTLDHILGIGDTHFAGAGAFMDNARGAGGQDRLPALPGA